LSEESPRECRQWEKHSYCKAHESEGSKSSSLWFNCAACHYVIKRFNTGKCDNKNLGISLEALIIKCDGKLCLFKITFWQVPDGIIAPGYDDEALDIISSETGGTFCVLQVCAITQASSNYKICSEHLKCHFHKWKLMHWADGSLLPYIILVVGCMHYVCIILHIYLAFRRYLLRSTQEYKFLKVVYDD